MLCSPRLQGPVVDEEADSLSLQEEMAPPLLCLSSLMTNDKYSFDDRTVLSTYISGKQLTNTVPLHMSSDKTMTEAAGALTAHQVRLINESSRLK